MTTKNISISGEWTTVVANNTNPFLISFENVSAVEFCVTTELTTNEFPTYGHLLSYREAITRQTLGTGFVWARSKTGKSVTVVVSESEQ